MKRQIDSNSVFLVSGGAKGITAQSAIKLAQCYQCKFILLGRSAIDESEPTWAQDCFNEAELKRRIMEYLLATGTKPTPRLIEREFKVIASQREIKQTLRAIEQAGGQAEYLSVDVTDAIALQPKLVAAMERLGAVTGIIHGAGNLADKLIEKKTEQDFESVYAPKVKGLENLLRCVPASQLDHLVLFSSVAGFFGNRGQADYALANEILNKSAHWIQRNYPNCHVVAINWGPWESGMVTPQLKQAFAERNVTTIPVAAGTQLLVNELALQNQASVQSSVQVVMGDPLELVLETLPPTLQTFRISRRLTLAANPFLRDHVIGGRPVLPATCVVGWVSSACEQLYPGYKFLNLSNFKVLKGIIFDSTLADQYVLDLQEIVKSNTNQIELEARICSKNQTGKIYYHYSLSLELRRHLPEVPVYEKLLTAKQATSDTNELFYQTGEFYQTGDISLFHGSTFRGVQRVLQLSAETITTECFVSKIGESQQGQFPVQTINPYIADVQFHPMWIWLQHFHQAICLPSAIQKYEQFAETAFDQIFYISTEIKSKTETALIADVTVHDPEGRIYSRTIGARGTVLSPQRIKAQMSNQVNDRAIA